MNPFDPSHARFCRDSRHAFGHRFYVEKPSSDWPYIVASIAAAAMLVALIAVLA